MCVYALACTYTLLNSISATAYIQRSAIQYIQGVKATALLFVATVSKQKLSAHFIVLRSIEYE